MLSGRVAFEGTAVRKMYGHISDPVPSLAEAGRGDLATRFDPILGRAMAKDPEERYPSAGDLGRALAAACANRIVTVPEREVAVGEASSQHTPSTDPARTRQAEGT